MDQSSGARIGGGVRSRDCPLQPLDFIVSSLQRMHDVPAEQEADAAAAPLDRYFLIAIAFKNCINPHLHPRGRGA